MQEAPRRRASSTAERVPSGSYPSCGAGRSGRRSTFGAGRSAAIRTVATEASSAVRFGKSGADHHGRRLEGQGRQPSLLQSTHRAQALDGERFRLVVPRARLRDAGGERGRQRDLAVDLQVFRCSRRDPAAWAASSSRPR